MKRFKLVVMFLLVLLGLTTMAKAQDVVYLKDGSIIHGTIIEEEPGVSLKIQTNDGNVFFYKVKQIKKITHTKAEAAEDEDQAPATTTEVVVKHRKNNFENDFKTDPDGKYSLGAVFFGVGIMNPSVINQFNNILTAAYGSSYDFTPIAYSGDIGIGWYTNHLALKFTGTFGFNFENQNYYYNSYAYYALNEFIGVYGGEIEADFSLDDVQTSKSRPNAVRVASVYLPLLLGAWDTSLTTYDNYGNSDTLTGLAESFGTGIGGRFIDENHNMFDFQLLYRWSNSATLKDSYGYYLVQPGGTKLNSSVAGLAFNINYGFMF
jgi:hypothetical protein